MVFAFLCNAVIPRACMLRAGLQRQRQHWFLCLLFPYIPVPFLWININNNILMVVCWFGRAWEFFVPDRLFTVGQFALIGGGSRWWRDNVRGIGMDVSVRPTFYFLSYTL